MNKKTKEPYHKVKERMIRHSNKMRERGFIYLRRWVPAIFKEKVDQFIKGLSND